MKVSGATIASRILGLVRDAATMAYMSFGAVSAGYTIAFTLPNLFRRLLGEGALTSAMVPIFSQSLRENGKTAAFAFLNKTLTRAGLLLLGLTIFLMVAAFISTFFLGGAPERFLLGASFSVVILPYMALICLAAVFTAALNVLDSFGVPSVTPALLNIVIIASLFAGVAVFGKTDTVAIGYCMCVGWLIGGALQMGLPAYWLYRMGWRFSPDLGKTPELSELYALFLPALLGAAVIQLNIFISKFLALFLSDSALPSIYLSGRILEFPLGVFTIAIATVYFPKLAAVALKDVKEYRAEYRKGMIMTLCISIPAMFGIIVLSRDILTFLFKWGLFSNSDIDTCLPILIASVAGLPFFAAATFATRGFHSAKDTRTPVKISIYSFFINIALSLILMGFFGAVGLVAANIGAAAFQAAALQKKLAIKFGTFKFKREVLKILAASLVMTAFVFGTREVMALFLEGKILALSVCVSVIPAGIAVYFACLKMLKFEEMDAFKKIAGRIRK